MNLHKLRVMPVLIREIKIHILSLRALYESFNMFGMNINSRTKGEGILF